LGVSMIMDKLRDDKPFTVTTRIIPANTAKTRKRAINIIPFIVSISVEVLRMVPEQVRECALALGATKW